MLKAKVKLRLRQHRFDEVGDVAFNPFHVPTSGLLPVNELVCVLIYFLLVLVQQHPESPSHEWYSKCENAK